MKMKIIFRASKEIDVPDELANKWLKINNTIETSENMEDWDAYSNALNNFYNYIENNTDIKKISNDFEGEGVISADFIIDNKSINFYEQ